MSSAVVRICSSIVARSRLERHFKALSKKSRPADDAGRLSGAKLSFEGDEDVGDVGFEGVSVKPERGRLVWLAMVGEWEKGFRKRRSRSRNFAGVVALVIGPCGVVSGKGIFDLSRDNC